MIAIIAILMAILMPALRRVREQGKMIKCQANLKQWNLIFAMYTGDNNGKFWSGLTGSSPGFWWPWQLEDRLKDWKNNEIWFCPTAPGTKPRYNEDGVEAPNLSIFNSWGIYTNSETDNVTHITYSAGQNGINGSFGLNGYVLTIPGNTNFQSGVPASDGWRTPNVSGAYRVPLFLDALRFDLWPVDTEGPAVDEHAFWGSNHMARCCINRHQGFIDCSFLDFSSRKIGLKELWTLKWHKSFNTAGPWTLAGGVQPDDWPDWIRNYTDY